MRSAGVPGTKSSLWASDIRYRAVCFLSIHAKYHCYPLSSIGQKPKQLDGSRKAAGADWSNPDPALRAVSLPAPSWRKVTLGCGGKIRGEGRCFSSRPYCIHSCCAIEARTAYRTLLSLRANASGNRNRGQRSRRAAARLLRAPFQASRAPVSPGKDNAGTSHLGITHHQRRHGDTTKSCCRAFSTMLFFY